MEPPDKSQQRPPDDGPDGPSRRTVLAAERTWLAWWRTAIAVSAAAIAVGSVIPRLVEGSRLAYVLLGIGYALLAIAVFAMALMRHRQVERALGSGSDIESAWPWMFGLTVGGGVLAIATLLLIVVDA